MSPMSVFSRGTGRTIDYKKAFDYWTEYKTSKKASLAMQRDGLTNPDGEPYKSCTIRRSAWIWVIEHPEEAMEYWQSLGHFPDGMDDENWKHWICKKMRTWAYSEKALIMYLKINRVEDFFNANYKKNNSCK